VHILVKPWFRVLTLDFLKSFYIFENRARSWPFKSIYCTFIIFSHKKSSLAAFEIKLPHKVIFSVFKFTANEIFKRHMKLPEISNYFFKIPSIFIDFFLRFKTFCFIYANVFCYLVFLKDMYQNRCEIMPVWTFLSLPFTSLLNTSGHSTFNHIRASE